MTALPATRIRAASSSTPHGSTDWLKTGLRKSVRPRGTEPRMIPHSPARRNPEPQPHSLANAGNRHAQAGRGRHTRARALPRLRHQLSCLVSGEMHMDMGRVVHISAKRAPEMAPACLSSVQAWHTFGAFRSEEHTSELQSLMRISYDVFCLKKKKNN